MLEEKLIYLAMVIIASYKLVKDSFVSTVPKQKEVLGGQKYCMPAQFSGLLVFVRKIEYFVS